MGFEDEVEVDVFAYYFHAVEVVGGYGDDEYAVLVVVGSLDFGEVGTHLVVDGWWEVG